MLRKVLDSAENLFFRIFLQNFQNENREALIQGNVYMSDPG